MTDKKFQNQGNTADLAGVFQSPVVAFAFLQEAVDNCHAQVSPTHGMDHRNAGKKKTCMQLGNEKHKCMEKKITEMNQDPKQADGTGIEGECGYNRPPGPMKKYPNREAIFKTAVEAGITAAGPGATGNAIKKSVTEAIGKALAGKCFPDAAIVHPDGSKSFIDFKFPCPKDHPTGRGVSKGNRKTKMDERQQTSYDLPASQLGANHKSFAVTPRF